MSLFFTSQTTTLRCRFRCQPLPATTPPLNLVHSFPLLYPSIRLLFSLEFMVYTATMKLYTIILTLFSATAVLSREIVQSANNLRGRDDDAPPINQNGGHNIMGGVEGVIEAVFREESLCFDVLQTCTTSCINQSGGSKTRTQCRSQCTARMIQTCTNNCVNRSSGSKTRSQCRTQCTTRYRNGGGSGSESTGPGKHFTIAPTPAPPSRGRIYCIQNCIAKGGSTEVQRMCKAKCPVPEFDWEIC